LIKLVSPSFNAANLSVPVNDDDAPVPVEVDAAKSAVTKAAQEISTFDS
jgi:hypothetical protein